MTTLPILDFNGLRQIRARVNNPQYVEYFADAEDFMCCLLLSEKLAISKHNKVISNCANNLLKRFKNERTVSTLMTIKFGFQGLSSRGVLAKLVTDLNSLAKDIQ